MLTKMLHRSLASNWASLGATSLKRNCPKGALSPEPQSCLVCLWEYFHSIGLCLYRQPPKIKAFKLHRTVKAITIWSLADDYCFNICIFKTTKQSICINIHK